MSGYSTQFLQPGKEVKKAWWRYIKSKAVINNQVTHYDLKFPGEKGSKDVLAVSIFEANDSTGISTLSVAIRPDSLNSLGFRDLNLELKTMLLDFKVSYFTGILQHQIKSQEKKATQLSVQIQKLRQGKNKEGLTSEEVKAREDGILYSLNQVEQNLDSLKLQLRQIK